MLPFATNSPTHAQSIPAGQITSRMKSGLTTPEPLLPIVVPNFADLVPQRPSQSATPAANALPPEVLNNVSKAIQGTAQNLNIKPETRDLLIKSLSEQLGLPSGAGTQRSPNAMPPETLNNLTNAIQDTERNPNLSTETEDEVLTSYGKQLAAAPAPPATEPAPYACSTSADGDQKMSSNALGTASKDAWDKIIELDNAIPTADPTILKTARKVACAITDALDFKAALHVVKASRDALDKMQGLEDAQKKAAEAGIDAIGNIPAIKEADSADAKKVTPPCWQTAIADTGDATQNSDSAASQGSANGSQSSSSANAPANSSKQNSKATGTSKAKSTPEITYHRPAFLPLFRKGCHADANILDFFAASSHAEAANSVEYLYNAQQSASAVTGDLLTATFPPGFQVILAGTATTGSGTSNNSTSSSSGIRRGARLYADAGSSSGNSSTDTVDTALAKLENGGDFNLRVPIPLLFIHNDNWSLTANASPNVGFNLNNSSGQQTITDATEYSGNFPGELYFQAGSVKDPSGSTVTAVGFLDARVAGEWISSALAKQLSVSSSTFFPIVQVAGGIEFAQRFRISLQYIYSTPQFCQVAGAASCTTSGSSSSSVTSSTKINGFHLAVSFSPQKSKNNNSSN